MRLICNDYHRRSGGVGALCLLAVAARAAALEPPSVEVDIEVTVDWDETHQTIAGFGGTMGWIHPGERVRDEVFDLLFMKLGASVLRIRALGGEGDDELSIEPKNDNSDPDTFNWPAFPVYLTEAKNAAVVKEAVARGVRTVVPTSWSPPGWMKDTGKRAGGGTLREDMPDEFAEAWAAYVIAMKREFDVDIRLLSVQNEPDLTYYYPTCGFTPEHYARTVRAVQTRLDRENLAVRVLGPDVCRIYNLRRYLEEMEREGYDMGGPHLDAQLVEGRARKPLLTHLYDLAIPYENVERDAERWQEARNLARRHGRALWFMETANYLSVGVEEGSYEEAVIWARKIHHALADGDCEVVCYWALFFDKIGEALVYCPRNGSDEYAATPKFYTSMNYFRFVRPGMRRVRATSTDPDLFVTAFADESSQVIVMVNWAEAARRASLPVRTGETWERHETTSTRSCERIPLAMPSGACIRLPARSVTTFVRASAG